MPSQFRRLITPAVAVMVVAFVALPAAALGQASEIQVTLEDPVVNQSPTEVIQQAPIPAGKKPSGDDKGATAPAVAATPAPSGGSDDTVGRLPFTGIDLLMLVGVAMLVTGVGFAVRQAARPRHARF